MMRALVAQHFAGAVCPVMYKFDMTVLLDQNKLFVRERGNA
jgi:hypothetical protein